MTGMDSAHRNSRRKGVTQLSLTGSLATPYMRREATLKGRPQSWRNGSRPRDTPA